MDAPATAPAAVAAPAVRRSRGRIAASLDRAGFRVRRAGTPTGPAAAPVLGTVLLLTLGPVGLGDPLDLAIAQLSEGLWELLQADGGNLLCAQYPGSGPLPAMLTDALIDGIVVCGQLRHVPSALHDILRAVPTVWVLRPYADPQWLIDQLGCDDVQAGTLAAEHLLAGGARRPAVINDLPRDVACIIRQEAFLAVCRAHELPVVSRNVDGIGVRSLREALRALMLMRERPDAIFLPADGQTVEACHMLCGLGVEPQAQVRLIGCGDDPLVMRHLRPAMPTIDLRYRQLAETALDRLALRRSHPALPQQRLLVAPAVVLPGDVPAGGDFLQRHGMSFV